MHNFKFLTKISEKCMTMSIIIKTDSVEKDDWSYSISAIKALSVTV